MNLEVLQQNLRSLNKENKCIDISFKKKYEELEKGMILAFANNYTCIAESRINQAITLHSLSLHISIVTDHTSSDIDLPTLVLTDIIHQCPFFYSDRKDIEGFSEDDAKEFVKDFVSKLSESIDKRCSKIKEEVFRSKNNFDTIVLSAKVKGMEAAKEIIINAYNEARQ